VVVFHVNMNNCILFRVHQSDAKVIAGSDKNCLQNII
jgi:hypothetical protein